jgi:hypothetical protein
MDRTLLEYSPELETFETDEFEVGAYGLSGGTGSAGVFNETEELELAAVLLEVTNERELDRFLANLIAKAERAIGRHLSSPIKQALCGLLKSVAKNALPMLGSALGAQIGGQLASVAGRVFGLELEGLSPEDKEFEIAKSFVRFAGAAVRNAVYTPVATAPQAVAQKAIRQAARHHAPGLQQRTGASASERTGYWYRRGRNIVVNL